jgi:hypothetical protein
MRCCVACRPLRHHLLRLLEALVSPEAASSEGGRADGSAVTVDGAGGAGAAAPYPPPASNGSNGSTGGGRQPSAAAAAAQANADALVAAGGVGLMVDLVTTAHEASDRPVTAALQSNLIANASAAEGEAKEWYHYPTTAGAAAAEQVRPAAVVGGVVFNLVLV